MAAHSCPNCRQLVQFEAQACGSCGVGLGFDPLAGSFAYVDAGGAWHGHEPGPCPVRRCGNARYGVCNWLVALADPTPMCRACRHNRVIPDLSIPGVLDRWRRIEEAKRRMIHGLIRLGLPLETRLQRRDGLAFDFLYDASAEKGWAPQLMTGHQGGLVTLNLIEADDVARERLRRDLGEPYRTLVGHFRHEVAHHYWHRLIEWSPDLQPFRRVFGDERADYAAAMRTHYAQTPAAGWEETHVSAYATVHPWEDFAETFAHYLHIVDTLATIGDFGARLDPPGGGPATAVDFSPYAADTATLVSRWIPFAFALNAINRSMGQRDLYPFHLSPGVVTKLDFVNRLIAFAAGRWTPGDREGAGLRAMIALLGYGTDLTPSA